MSTNKWAKRRFTALLVVLSSHGWFKIHRSLVEILGLEAAAMLHYLIDVHVRVQRSPDYKWNEGWFYCMMKKISKEINVSPGAQTRILTKLTGKNKTREPVGPRLIEMKKMGLPARRFVRIDGEAIEDIIFKWVKNQRNQSLGNQRNRMEGDQRDIVRLNKTEQESSMSTPCGADGDRSPPPSDGRKRRKANPPSKFDHRAVEELIKVVSSHIKVNRKHNLKEWANQIRMMRELDGVAKEEIKRTVRWYAEHIGEEYVPEAFSARTFRQKYKDGKFIAAMRRAGDTEALASDGVDEDRLIVLVRNALRKTGWDPDDQAFQEDVDEALVGMGLKPGRIDAACV